MLDLYELNKIAGAVLFSILLLLGVGTVTSVIFTVEKPERPGYVIEVAEVDGEAEAAETAADEPALAELLARASAEKGETAARRCVACHTFDAGGANRVGPNLHGIVGRALAAHEGFAYSDAMKNKGGEWGYEELDAFLVAPRRFVPGTSMAFAGIRRADERADLILYLKSVSPDAPELPE